MNGKKNWPTKIFAFPFIKLKKPPCLKVLISYVPYPTFSKNGKKITALAFQGEENLYENSLKNIMKFIKCL